MRELLSTSSPQTGHALLRLLRALLEVRVRARVRVRVRVRIRARVRVRADRGSAGPRILEQGLDGRVVGLTEHADGGDGRQGVGGGGGGANALRRGTRLVEGRVRVRVRVRTAA